MIGFKEFMKNKRTRYGLNLFILACSNSGYAHTLKLEEGLRPGEATRVGYGGTVIKELVEEGKLEKGSTVYENNWFTVVHLPGPAGAVAEGQETLPCRNNPEGQEDVND